MGGWTFQLQQEGDEAWLPLESPDVEILEGRYRLIGRGSTDAPALNLRITYLPLGEPEPFRRGVNRSLTADAEVGYLLLPLMYLQPGEWELRLEGGPTLKLQVLPREATGLSDPIWQSPETSIATPTDPLFLQDLPQDLPQERGYTLLLRQSQFQATPGDMLTLAGEIRSSQAVRGMQAFALLSLRIVLSDSQDQLVLDQYKSLDCETWPLPFQVPLRLPSHLSKGHLNGQLSLHHSLSAGTPLAVADLSLEVHCPASAMQWMIIPDPEISEPPEAPLPDSPTASDSQPADDHPTPVDEDAEDDLNLGDRLFRRLREIVLAAHGAAQAAEQIPANDPTLQPNPDTPHQLPQRASHPTAGVRPLDLPPPNLIRQEERVHWTPGADVPPNGPETAELPLIPEPQLCLPLDTCEPGTRVPLEFRLPRTARRLAVKWWLQDAYNQKRWGGFRLVLDFAPCSEQELLALTEIPLPPLGCTWTLEAVAFDLLSHQESRTVQLALPMLSSREIEPD
jgi:hypothetical protein